MLNVSTISFGGRYDYDYDYEMNLLRHKYM